MSTELEFYPIIDGSQRFIAVDLPSGTVKVRIPLQVWNSTNKALYRPYVAELKRKIKKAEGLPPALVSQSMS
jgi:hypothetical protein